MDEKIYLKRGMIVVVLTSNGDTVAGVFDKFINNTDCHLKKTYAFNRVVDECSIINCSKIREASLDEVKEFINLTGYNIFENPIIGPVLMRDIERFGYNSTEKKEAAETNASAAVPEPSPIPEPTPEPEPTPALSPESEVHQKLLPEDDRRPERPETDYKNDVLDDKLRWDLLPMAEVEDIVKLFHRGAKKYKPNSWKNLENGFERYRSALFRHMMAYLNGERYDPETEANHLTAVAWNALVMLWFDKNGKGLIKD